MERVAKRGWRREVKRSEEERRLGTNLTCGNLC
jgi:hypothetical protein